MSSPAAELKRNSPEAVYLLIILSFFMTGLFTSDKLLPPDFLSGVSAAGPVFSLMPVAAGILFSSSLLGLLLIPAEAYLFGLCSVKITGGILSSYLSGTMPEREGLLALCVSFPVFFIVCVRGMESSRVILASLLSGSHTAGKACMREYIPMIVSAALAAAAIKLITGKYI